MQTIEHARASNRSVLASMRDQAFVARNAVYGRRATSCWEIMLDLSVMPCGALGYNNPGKVTLDLLRRQMIAIATHDGPGMTNREQATGKAASRLIDQRIRDLGDWRGETLARMRALILEADPEMTEEWKWMGTPVWSHHGIVCTGETYAKVVKLTFARGASIPDPSHLFNSSLTGNTRRAIDIHEEEKVDARAFKALVKAAVARNRLPAKKR